MTDESPDGQTQTVIDFDIAVAVDDASDPYASEIFDALRDGGVDVKAVSRQPFGEDSREVWGDGR